MASYLYYNINIESPMSDEEYDILCKRLHNEWDEIEHPHKSLIDRDALKSGTGFYINKYPTMVMGAALNWANSYK
jgi:NAD-dependent DNA ligase